MISSTCAADGSFQVIVSGPFEKVYHLKGDVILVQ